MGLVELVVQQQGSWLYAQRKVLLHRMGYCYGAQTQAEDRIYVASVRLKDELEAVDIPIGKEPMKTEQELMKIRPLHHPEVDGYQCLVG